MKLRLATATLLIVGSGGSATLRAQAPDSAPALPVAGEWTPIRSLGQPTRWKPWYGLGVGQGREAGEDVTLFSGSLGIYRDLGSPLGGRLGWQVEAYGGAAGSRLDGGGRFLLRSPRFLLGGGVDYNLRRDEARGVVSLQFPPVRGGLFGRGGDLRLDWLPGDGQVFQLGVQFPLGQPHLGRTRPRQVEAALPVPVRPVRPAPVPPASRLAAELDTMRAAARGLSRLASTFLGPSAPAALPPGAFPHRVEVRRYHAALERAFGLASGAPDSVARAAGATLAAAARRIVLEEVVLPWNRTVGRPRRPASIEGLAARARSRFIGWLARGPAAADPAAALLVLDSWLAELEAIRADLADRAADARRAWLPVALVLRPEEHRTQEQVDRLLADALGAPFPGGNAILHFPAQQFQVELARTIQQAERYHVLWVDDFRGVDDAGQPDRIGFYHAALGYLAALTRRVREYDRTGRLPAYLLLLDQQGYDRAGSRLWLDLLERPLDHRVSLPAPHEAMTQVITAWQDSLRRAVADSRRLGAEALAFGPGRIRELVKVHVNVTNPSDLSFRTPGFLGLPLTLDNAARDHREVVIRDVSAADPAAGEVILAGVGVGDRYTDPGREDRGMLLTGPAAAGFVSAARDVLLENGFPERDIPPVLRDAAPPPEYPWRVAALEAAGATARVLQAHNRTGWNEKEATFLQLLLWDVVPAGTVMYVPDPHWEDPLWPTALLAAALRGCEVYVVAPSAANAPPEYGGRERATRELLARLFAAGRGLGEAIRAGGGDLRLGLYTRRAPIGAPQAKLAEVDTTYGKYAFLRSQYPFPEATWSLLRGHQARMDSAARADGTPAEVDEARPRLHQRSQFLASRALMDELALQPETQQAVDLMLRRWSEGLTVTPEQGPIPAQRRLDVARAMMEGYEYLPAPVRDSTLLYLAVGTLGKDTRAMARDGEAMALVSGRWALAAYLDFWSLFGSTTWLERPEDLTELLPPRR